MGASKQDGMQRDVAMDQTGEDPVESLIDVLRTLPASARTSSALGIASRLIEFAAFEMAGRESATDVADLINCAARMDFASTDLQSLPCLRAKVQPRRLQ
ncbi:hypothetical protein [Roseobacter sp.]